VIRIVAARINEIVDIVCPRSMIFEVTARVFLVARPIKVGPNKCEQGKMKLTTEVFDMLSERVEWPFTVGASAALHLL
jgi:hypothetical protein